MSHKLQCDALGGLNILHVKQYFNLTVCPLTNTSFVLGGGLYVGLFAEFVTSKIISHDQMLTNICTIYDQGLTHYLSIYIRTPSY